MINLSYLDGLNDDEIYSALKSNFLLKSMIQSHNSIVQKAYIIYLAVFYVRKQFNGRLFLVICCLHDIVN